MTTVYKLTDAQSRTRSGQANETQWGPGATHEAPGGDELCTSAWIHAYGSPEIAVLMDPIHASYGQSALLWECEATVRKSDGTKLGCIKLTTLRRVSLPMLSPAQCTRIAIFCALSVCDEPSFTAWARAWLGGSNRLEAAARAAGAAARAAARAAEAAEGTAGAAAWAAARAAEAAAWAAEAAARAAEGTAGDSESWSLASIIKQALEETAL